MNCRWTLPAIALALVLCPAVAADPPTGGATEPSADVAIDKIFSRFDHKRHNKVLREHDLGCPACHQVGGVSDAKLSSEALETAYLSPPPKACHYCHNPADSDPIAPSRCTTCHDSVAPPTSHGAAWVQHHGAEARLGLTTCDDCHKAKFCTDCHYRKEPVRRKVHDRSWMSVHGIAVKANPAQCSTCHLQQDCVACHATADGRRP